MKLTSKQIKYVNAEQKNLVRIIKEKEENNIWRGRGGDMDRLQIIRTIIELHNLEVKEDGSDKTKVSEYDVGLSANINGLLSSGT